MIAETRRYLAEPQPDDVTAEASDARRKFGRVRLQPLTHASSESVYASARQDEQSRQRSQAPARRARHRGYWLTGFHPNNGIRRPNKPFEDATWAADEFDLVVDVEK